MEDERVLYRAKRHPCPLIGDAVGTVLLMSGLAAAFFAGIVESLRDPQLARGLDPNLDLYVYSTLLIVLVSICAGSVLRQYIVYRTAEFAVTNMRVLSKSGLRSKHTFGILLSDVKGVSVDQGVLGRMLGYGTVIVTGTGGSKELFPCMSAPFEFQKKVQEQIEAIRDQK
jgi:uncharacterized membrane protein YdbT with pleckstrin-like domain